MSTELQPEVAPVLHSLPDAPEQADSPEPSSFRSCRQRNSAVELYWEWHRLPGSLPAGPKLKVLKVQGSEQSLLLSTQQERRSRPEPSLSLQLPALLCRLRA